MCKTDSYIAPTKHGVYLRKTTKSKKVKAEAVTSLVLRRSSSFEDSADDSDCSPTKYVFRHKSSTDAQKKGKKQGRSTCGGDCGKCSYDGKLCFYCDAKDEKRKKKKEKGFLHFRTKFGDCCHCSGKDNDGWQCDACRAEEKKKRTWKFVEHDAGSCCSSDNQHCDDSSSECDCDDCDGNFVEKCRSWMKDAAKKRNEQKGKHVCNCRRPGCNICVIINC